MTEAPQVAADQLPVRIRASIAGLAVLVAVGFGSLLWLIFGPLHEANRERRQLACQVQQLGGERIGHVHCPPTPTPAGHPGRTGQGAVPTLTPAPGDTAVVVVPPPFGPASNPRPLTPRKTTDPQPQPSHSSRPPHHPSGDDPTPVACATVGPLHACLDKPLTWIGVLL